MTSYPVERTIDREYRRELHEKHKNDPIFAPRPLPSLAVVLKLPDRGKCPMCAGKGRCHVMSFYPSSPGVYRYTLHNERCDDCNGKGYSKFPKRLNAWHAQPYTIERTDPCADCKGTGQDLESGCPDCEGINCQKCRGTGGAKPCGSCKSPSPDREERDGSLGFAKTKVNEIKLLDGTYVRLEDHPEHVPVLVENEIGGVEKRWKPEGMERTPAEIASDDWPRKLEEAQARRKAEKESRRKKAA